MSGSFEIDNFTMQMQFMNFEPCITNECFYITITDRNNFVGGTEIASSAVPLPPCASQALARGVGAVLSEHLGVDVYAAVRESQG